MLFQLKQQGNQLKWFVAYIIMSQCYSLYSACCYLQIYFAFALMSSTGHDLLLYKFDIDEV